MPPNQESENPTSIPHVPLPLRTLLGYPYLWKPVTITRFLKESYNLIKEGENPELKRELNAASAKAFTSTDSWIDVIGKKDFAILNRNAAGKQETYSLLEAKSVVQLHRLIRNKHEHSSKKKFNFNERKILGWFTPSGVLDENKFALYWITKFPLLLPFLWVKFQKLSHSSTLENFYGMMGEKNLIIMGINMFIAHIHQTLNLTLEQGSLIQRFRYKTETEEHHLEFRACTYVDKILTGNSSVSFQTNLKDHLIRVSHFFKERKKVEVLRYTGLKSEKSSENLTLIFSDSTLDDKMSEYFASSSGRVIFFGEEAKLDPENIEKFVKKFSSVKGNVAVENFPLTFKDLTVSKRAQIIEKESVIIQDRNVQIAHILPGYKNHDVLNNVSGCLFRQLICHTAPTIFAQYKLPQRNTVYLEREVKLKEHTYRENEFVEKVCTSGIEPLLVVAPTGWGKSQFLASVGQLLKSRSFVVIVPMRDFADKLKMHIKDGKCIKDDIKAIMKKVLLCENNLEKLLLDEWLEQKSHEQNRIDLILDGFDEILVEYQKLAKEFIQIIRNDIPVVRLWISSREGSSEDAFFSKFFSCTINAFSEPNQMSYFTWYIKNSKSTEKQLDDLQLAKKAYKFKELLDAVKCKLNIEIATTPLHCHIIAEYFEDKIDYAQATENSNETLTIAKLYEGLIDKKLLLYIKEKESIEISSDSISVKFLKNSLLRLHKHLGLKFMLPQLKYNKFRKPDVMLDVKEEQYSKMGIVNRAEPLTFIHNTFAEYLVAKFIFEVLHTGILRACSKETFHKLFHDVLISSFDKPASHYTHAICYFLNDMLWEHDTKNLEWVKKNKYKPNLPEECPTPGFLSMTFRHKYWNITWLVLNLWEYKKSDESKCRVLKIAIRYSISEEKFDKLCQMLEFNDEYLDLMRKLHYKIFETALQENTEIAKYLVENWFPPECWSVIPKMNESHGHIMHVILDSVRLSDSTNTGDEIKRKQNDRVELLKYIYGLIPSTIKDTDKHGRTPLQKIQFEDFAGDYNSSKEFLQKLF